jgi:hypothetical protein
MSTNSGIAVRAGETFQTIYCHWDGHPRTMLPILRENYNSFDLANMLISMGDASSIDLLIGPNPNKPHDFMNPQEDVCVFYHRDRGDDWESCRSVCYTWKELLKQQAFDYIYIFEDGQWNVYKRNGERIYI